MLAHPGRMDNDALIPELVASGLQGLEVFYPTHTLHQTAKYLAIATKYQLFPTGGSDYHGASNQTRLGDAQVDGNICLVQTELNVQSYFHNLFHKKIKNTLYR